MYKSVNIGGKTVGIAQTMRGWNVSTFTVTGNKVRTLKSANFKTLQDAQNEFKKQKDRLSKKKTNVPLKKKPRKQKSWSAFQDIGF